MTKNVTENARLRGVQYRLRKQYYLWAVTCALATNICGHLILFVRLQQNALRADRRSNCADLKYAFRHKINHLQGDSSTKKFWLWKVTVIKKCGSNLLNVSIYQNAFSYTSCVALLPANIHSLSCSRLTWITSLQPAVQETILHSQHGSFRV